MDTSGPIPTAVILNGPFSPLPDAKAQARIDQLARKCNEGELSEEERREYETYVHTIDFIAILQAKARALLKRSSDA
jgi:hypothetical protein